MNLIANPVQAQTFSRASKLHKPLSLEGEGLGRGGSHAFFTHAALHPHPNFLVLPDELAKPVAPQAGEGMSSLTFSNSAYEHVYVWQKRLFQRTSHLTALKEKSS